MKVYLIRDGEFRYKIGISHSPKSRLKQLQTAGATVYELIYELDCKNASKVERMLHRYYENSRKIGEWFELPEDIVRSFPDMVKKLEASVSMLRETSTLRKPI